MKDFLVGMVLIVTLLVLLYLMVQFGLTLTE